MRVALRVDASVTMGIGHLRRCLSLAQALDEQGAALVLVTRALDEVAGQVLQKASYPVTWLPPVVSNNDARALNDLPPHQAYAGVTWQKDASDTCDALSAAPPDWLIIDHYAFDARWHAFVRQRLGCRLLVIDDIADRALAADVLLDQNWHSDHRAKYQGRLSQQPAWLVGPRYALLSEGYRAAARYKFNAQVKSIGIFMGGTDPGGVTGSVLACVRAEARFEGLVEVVSTSSSPYLDRLRAACLAWPNTSLTLDEPDLASFFSRHDLHIGAGGGATWERCCMGAPTIALVVADNQAASVPGLHRSGIVRAARLRGFQVTEHGENMQWLPEALSSLLHDPQARQLLSTASTALVDGRGAQRVALRLMRETLALRPATPEDAKMLYEWRNHPAIREVSGSGAPIAYAEHVHWMQKVLCASDRWLFVAQVGKLPVGSIRFDRLDADTLEVSLYLDPDLQGLGLGHQLLLGGERTMSRLLGLEVSIHAVVTPGNQASCRLFESCGYGGGPTLYRKSIMSHIQESESTP